MTKEELIQFLKDNLKVTVYDASEWYDDGISLTVDIFLGEEKISSDYTHFYTK